MNKIDIVIVTYKSYGYLERCISSIYEDSSSQGFIQDIIVVDNAPSDTYWDSRPRIFDNVVVLKSEKNLGFAQAVNLGIKKCSAAYILLLNPDTIVNGNMIARSVAFMDQHPKVGIIGPKILNGDGSVQGSARGFPKPFTGLFGRSTLLTKWFPKNPITRQNVLTAKSDGITPMEVDWVSGACMVVRRKALDDVGHMDERFFMYWEDADWCKRMWQSGWKVVYFPQAHIVHYVGGSSEKRLLASVVEFHKSCYRLFEKYNNKLSFRLLTPLVIGGLGVRLCLVLFSNGMRVWSDSLQSHMKLRAAAVAAEGRVPIKVLLMIARLNIGGPTIHVYLLTNGLDGNKFDTILVTGKISPDEGDMTYIIDASDGKPITIPQLQRELSFVKDVKSFFSFLRILDEEKPDIVHTHTAKAGAIGRVAVFVHNMVQSLKFGVQCLVQRVSPWTPANSQSAICNPQCKVVHTFHGHVFHGYFGKLKSQFFVWAERMLAKITDVVIVISDSQKSELCGNYRIAPANKIRTVELGFDLEPFFSAEPPEGLFRKTLGVDGNTILVGIVGRLVPIKNHKTFLKCAKIFLDHNSDIAARFLIIGDGELKNDLMTYCGQQGLSGHVNFCGWERELPKVYADLDILALTSINEGTPVSIIEAMASGIPVISTDAGGVRDLLGVPVQDISSGGFRVHERGILCQQDDAEGLAEGLKYLVRNHARVKKEMSERARLFVEQSFSKERLLHDIESLYLELMAK